MWEKDTQLRESLYPKSQNPKSFAAQRHLYTGAERAQFGKTDQFKKKMQGGILTVCLSLSLPLGTPFIIYLFLRQGLTM